MTAQILPAPLQEAQDGSWFTIIGAGGDPQEWVDGIGGMLADEGIGTPSQWYIATGLEVNAHIWGAVDYSKKDVDWFPPDLTFLFFPLTGLEPGPLALFRLRGGHDWKWFDDLVDNNRRR